VTSERRQPIIAEVGRTKPGDITEWFSISFFN